MTSLLKSASKQNCAFGGVTLRHTSKDALFDTLLYAFSASFSVLKADLASLGGFKTLPYLVMFLTSNLGGWVGDFLILRRRFSVAAARKWVNTIGELFCHACLLLSYHAFVDQKNDSSLTR
jgi:hypothetical protein